MRRFTMAFVMAAACLLLTSGIAEARGGRCGGGRFSGGFFNRGCNTCHTNNNCGTCNTGCQQFAPVPANTSATQSNSGCCPTQSNSGCCPTQSNSGCCPTTANNHRGLLGFGCCGNGCR